MLVYVAIAAVCLWYSSTVVGWPLALHACGSFMASLAANKLGTLDHLSVAPIWRMPAGLGVLRVAAQLWLLPLVTGLIWVQWWAGLVALALAFPAFVAARIFLSFQSQLLAGLALGAVGLVWLLL